MIQRDRLPSGCLIRRATRSDTWGIYQLFMGRMAQFFLMLLFALSLLCLMALGLSFSFGGAVVGYTLIVSSTLFISLALILSYFTFIESQRWEQFWLVQCHHHLISYAYLTYKPNYTLLNSLYVKPPYRHQGIGSGLIRHLVHDVTRPIYLCCQWSLSGFYRRLGFVTATVDQIPTEWKNLRITNKVLVLH